MTREEFQKLPYLLTQAQVSACGYSPATIGKYAACEILATVKPAGCTQRRFQKVQLAEMLGWQGTIDRAAWGKEKPLMGRGAVLQWIGYSSEQFTAIVRAGGVESVRPGGIGEAKYRKDEIGKLIGI